MPVQRSRRRSLSTSGEQQPGSARRILDERLARGEIDAEEYRRLRETLDGAARPEPGAGDNRAGRAGHQRVRSTAPGFLPWPACGYAFGNEDYLRRLRKIEGQVRGLQKMIENETWCPDAFTRVASATRALQEVAVGLLSDHIGHCVSAVARAAPEDGEARLREVAAIIRQVTLPARLSDGAGTAPGVEGCRNPGAPARERCLAPPGWPGPLQASRPAVACGAVAIGPPPPAG